MHTDFTTVEGGKAISGPMKNYAKAAFKTITTLDSKIRALDKNGLTHAILESILHSFKVE